MADVHVTVISERQHLFSLAFFWIYYILSFIRQELPQNRNESPVRLYHPTCCHLPSTHPALLHQKENITWTQPLFTF